MRPTIAEINLDHILHNVNVLKSHIPDGTKFLAVIKANAYGHGLVDTALHLEDHVDYFGVAITEEGIRLREAGIRKPILILGATLPDEFPSVVAYDLHPAVAQKESLSALNTEAARQGKICGFHFKIDTGMNRIGFIDLKDFRDALDLLPSLSSLKFVGMFTHFAVSEISDPSFTDCQHERFELFIHEAHKRGFNPIIHAANSGAIFYHPSLHYDMVRGGISLYGYSPRGSSDIVDELSPALTWKTHVSFVKEIHPGDSVSYGRKYIADSVRRIATLPVGYGDGYKRCLSGKAFVLINGKRAPLIGTICMDQMMCDITDAGDVSVGDEVVLLGRQGNGYISADELADLASTISYEILLSINSRVPRVFIVS